MTQFDSSYIDRKLVLLAKHQKPKPRLPRLSPNWGTSHLRLNKLPLIFVKPRGTYLSSLRVIAKIEKSTTQDFRRATRFSTRVQFQPHGICRSSKSGRTTRTRRNSFVSCRF